MKQDLRKEFFHYVSLNVLGMIGLSCYILADTFFIAQALGPTGLAALNLSISIYSVIHAMGLMIGIGGATKFNILYSQGDQTGAQEIFTQALKGAFLLGSFFFLAGLLTSRPLSILLGADGETMAMTNTYLKTILIFAPCFLVNNVFLAFIRNDGNPNLALAAMLTGSIGNIILDYIFMFALGMGMFGAALATCLAPVMSILVLFRHFQGPSNCRWRGSPWRLNQLLEIGGLGLASFITELSSGVTLIVFNLTILKIAGNVGVAAYGIVANLALVALATFTGVAQGLQPLASRNHALGDTKALSKTLQYGLFSALALAVGIYLVTRGFTEGIVRAFNSQGDPLLARLAKEGLTIYFAGFFWAGVNIVLAGFYSATERIRPSFWVSITRGGLAIIPLVLLLSQWLGMAGVWLSFPLAEGLTSLIGLGPLLRMRAARLAAEGQSMG
ncbi:MAG: MATE family efflux transporter [Limnochordia bacterium]